MRCERKSFEGRDVRCYWDEERSEWRFSARDVIGALSYSAEPDVYWQIFIRRKDSRLSAIIEKLEKADISDGMDEETASAEQLMQLADFFPVSRRRDLASFINEVCTGFADSFAPLVVLEDGMLAADPSVDPTEQTIWLTADDIAVLLDTCSDEVTSVVESLFSAGEISREECEHRVVMAGNHETVFYSLRLVIAAALRIGSKAAGSFRSGLSSLAEGYIIRGYAADEGRLKALGCTLKIECSGPRAVNGGDADAAYAFIRRGERLARRKAEGSILHSGSYRISAEEFAGLVSYLDGELGDAEVARLEMILDKVFEVGDDGCERYESAEEKAAAFLWYLVKDAFVFTDELFIFFLYSNGLIREDSLFFDGITVPLLKEGIRDSAESRKEAVMETATKFISLLYA